MRAFYKLNANILSIDLCLIIQIIKLYKKAQFYQFPHLQKNMLKNGSHIKQTQASTVYNNNQQSKTFPLIPDQIHKVPQYIRRAIKVGKHRKNININANLNNNAKFNFESNAQLGENGKGKQKDNKDIKDGKDGKQVKAQSGLFVRQIFGFVGKVYGDEFIEKYDNQDDVNGKQTVTAKFFRSQGNKNRVSGDRILYARKKLTPLKKGLTVQPRSLGTRNLKVTFLNVQKVQLVKMYNQNEKQKQRYQSQIKIPINMVSTFGKNGSLIQNFLQSTGLSNQSPNFRRSFHDKSPSKIKLKPFTPPFQGYHYRDFIWKCAFSYNIFHQSPEVYEQKFKVFIGKGNNSMLLKSLLKRRKSWWVFTERYQQANFIWTQIKINAVFNTQKKQKSIYQQPEAFCPPQDNTKQNKTLVEKHNLKILSQHEYSHWVQYFTKLRRAQDTLDQTMKRRNRVFLNQKNKFTCKDLTKLDLKSIKVHNHLTNNYIISNKKALYYTMSQYYQKTNQDVFEYLPLTFHIQNGFQDPQYLKFSRIYHERAKKIRARQKGKDNPSVQLKYEKQQLQQPSSPTSPSRISVQNMWIVKPGQFTNRGNGITVCMNLHQIRAILKKRQRHDNGNLKTYIIQSYIQKPFLYQKRKFDLRHYMMITSINGIIKGYWYQYGYIRTTSFQYTIKHGFTSVHLTNDAVQKYLPQYGKYQKGNKISYEEFQKYLQKQYGNRYNFYEEVYPKMKKIAIDSIKACSLMIDPQKKGHNFQIFGMDFMIDGDFHPWLIQINNNPCLELSCPLLGQIIPPMVQNALKICLDSIFPPPATIPQQKKPKLNQNILQTNKFQLVYNSSTDEKDIKKLFGQQFELDINYKQLQKDQDQVFDDDGIELDD